MQWVWTSSIVAVGTRSLASGAPLTLASGRRGSLVIDDAHAYAIDLRSVGEVVDLGGEHSLIRRIQSGG